MSKSILHTAHVHQTWSTFLGSRTSFKIRGVIQCYDSMIKNNFFLCGGYKMPTHLSCEKKLSLHDGYFKEKLHRECFICFAAWHYTLNWSAMMLNKKTSIHIIVYVFLFWTFSNLRAYFSKNIILSLIKPETYLKSWFIFVIVCNTLLSIQ